MPLVDLDDPAELRARWSALAAVAHATGYDRRWWADEIGWHHEDAAGNDLRMVVLDDDRAVLFGFHIEYSQTAVQASGTDLLGGAPEWIAQPEVRHRIATGELGFVYGQFSGTWARAGYPGDPWQPIDDGFLAVGSWLTSDEETAAELVEWAAEWADFLGSTDHLMPAAVELVRAAGTTGISSDHLLDLFDMLRIGPGSPRHPDLAAALHAAADFGGPAPDLQPVAPAPQPADDWSGQDAFARLGLGDDPYYPEPAYDDPYQQPSYDDPYQPAGHGYADQPAPDPYPEPYTGARIEDYNDLFADSSPFAQSASSDHPAAGSPFAHLAQQPTARQSPDHPADPATRPDRWSPDAPPTHQDPTAGGSPLAPPAHRPAAGQPQDHAANASPFAPPTEPAARQSPDHPADRSPAFRPEGLPTQQHPSTGDRAADGSPFGPPAQRPAAEQPRDHAAEGSPFAPSAEQRPAAGEPRDHAAEESPFAPSAQQPPVGRSGERAAEESPFAPSARQSSAGQSGAGVADRTIRGDEGSSQAPPSQQHPSASQPGDRAADGSPFAPPAQQTPAARSGERVAEGSPFVQPAQRQTPDDEVTDGSSVPDRAIPADQWSSQAPPHQQQPTARQPTDQAADGHAEQQPTAERTDDRAREVPSGQQAAAGRSGDGVADGSPVADRAASPDERSPQPGVQTGGQVADGSPFAHRAQQPTDGQEGDPAAGESPFVPSEEQVAAGRSGQRAAGDQSSGGRPSRAVAGSAQRGGEPPQPDERTPDATSPRPPTAAPTDQPPTAAPPGQPTTATPTGQPPTAAPSGQPPAAAPTERPPTAVPGGGGAEQPIAASIGGTSLPGATVPPGVGKANGKAGKGRGSRRRDRGPDGVPEQRPEPAQASKLVFPSFIPPVTEEPPAAPVGSLEAAMRAETERKRPRQHRTEAEELLHEWCLARTRVVPSGFTIEVQALDPSALVFAFDLQPPPVPGFERIGGLLNDLWQAEAHADRGGWLFARIDAAGRTLRIDRSYDQIPSWWEHDLDDAVDVPGLLRRLSDRGPQWRPSYLNRLPAAR